MSETDSARKLSDLRVVDLRAELEKRGLDRSGNKQALVERLQKVCIIIISVSSKEHCISKRMQAVKVDHTL